MTEVLDTGIHARWRARSGASATRSHSAFAGWTATAPAGKLREASALDADTPYATLAIKTFTDIVAARRIGSLLARNSGFSASRGTLITTAIAELARNIVLYAGSGEIALSQVHDYSRRGIEVAAHDDGPGIENVERVLSGGFSTSGSLGLGLCGLRRIADEFRLDTRPGRGTDVSVTVWAEPEATS